MARIWAQIKNGIAWWIGSFNTPDGAPPPFHPSIVMFEVTNTVPMPSEGWTATPDGSGGFTFAPPAAPQLQPLSGQQIFALFTDAEQTALVAAIRSASPAIANRAQVIYDRLKSNQLFSSSDPRVVAAFTDMVTAGVLTAPRSTAILASFG